MSVEGEVAPRFAAVREAFAASFARREEVGASLAVTLDGEPVVDLWGGFTDAERSRAWQRDTLVCVYSSTKGMTALCVHQAVEQGLLDLDAPVVRWWPEFGAKGKEAVRLRDLLAHRAAVPAIGPKIGAETLYDQAAMAELLAAQEPWWPPGTAHGYHAVTFGHLAAEVLRRASGQSVGEWFRQRVAAPLGIDAHIGLAASEHDRVAQILPIPLRVVGSSTEFETQMKQASAVSRRTFNNPVIAPRLVNTAAWREAEIPAANGHANARALAAMYGALACGGMGLLSAEAIERARGEESSGADLVLFGVHTRFGLGFMLTHPEAAFGPNPTAFGHPGAGGSLGFADPTARLGFGYAMNQMQQGLLVNPRAARLIDAVYGCL